MEVRSVHFRSKLGGYREVRIRVVSVIVDMAHDQHIEGSSLRK